jgi:hypothetical protein
VKDKVKVILCWIAMQAALTILGFHFPLVFWVWPIYFWIAGSFVLFGLQLIAKLV